MATEDKYLYEDKNEDMRVTYLRMILGQAIFPDADMVKLAIICSRLPLK